MTIDCNRPLRICTRQPIYQLVPLYQNLLLRLQLIDNLNRDFKDSRNDVVRGKSKPLGERNIFNCIAFEVLNPDKLFIIRSILDVVTLIGER